MKQTKPLKNNNSIQPESLADFSEELLSSVPLPRAETIPSAWYTDRNFLDVDNAAVFSKTWQGVGHVDRLPNVGDYFLTEIADNPVIILRDETSQLRGFYNVCRHRGGPLATEDGNCPKVLQCKYHGWTYRLNGELRGVPDFNYVELFHKSDFGLVPINVDIWEGLIFATLNPSPPPLEQVFAGMTERFSPISLAGLHFHSRVTYNIKCNWKIYVDNYLEGYHVPLVHPELNNLLDYRNYVTETFENYSLQYSPLKESSNVYGDNVDEAFYFFVYPNFMLNLFNNRLQVNLVRPVSHDETEVIFDYYYKDVTSERAKKTISEDIEYSDLIQQEDIDICERVQKGVSSLAYDRGRFSVKRESGVHHFQELLKRSYRDWRDAQQT